MKPRARATFQKFVTKNKGGAGSRRSGFLKLEQLEEAEELAW